MVFLGRAELLLLIPLPLAVKLLPLLMLFEPEDEMDGSRDERTLPLVGGKAELFEEVLGTEELRELRDGWLCGVCDSGTSIAEVGEDGPGPPREAGNLIGS